MGFLNEPEPARHTALPVLPGIRRIVAENSSPMTYHGTNTYLIETGNGRVVLDPGPDDARHVEAILAATDGAVDLILVSHGHRDHFGAVAALAAATGAMTAGFHAPATQDFAPDLALQDGHGIAGMRVLHTPGHASDHICLAMTGEDGSSILFSGDHVMSWNSSIVNPPDGQMAAYFASLRLLLDRADEAFLPGHGPPLPEPRRLVRALLLHRLERERAIETALARGPTTTLRLREAMYSQTHPNLQLAAERNVLAHLLKLETEGKARRDGEGWRPA